jgi:hypothetical protein
VLLLFELGSQLVRRDYKLGDVAACDRPSIGIDNKKGCCPRLDGGCTVVSSDDVNGRVNSAAILIAFTNVKMNIHPLGHLVVPADTNRGPAPFLRIRREKL